MFFLFLAPHILKKIRPAFFKGGLFLKHSLPLKNSLVAGTLLLTLAGSLSRVIGFFYRIFLSRTIGAEGIGIYQLIFPLLALCISLTSSGIQTAVSKFTAEKYGSGRTGEAFLCLYAGFFLSIASSLSACTFLCRYADALAAGYLDEPRCAPLIRIMAYSLPFSAVHACANGYYYGMKKAAVPAVSQLLEQVVRVASVYVIALIYTEKGAALSADIAVWGIVCGEIFSALFCITVLPFQKKQGHFIGMLKNIALFSLPLTANRVALNFFQSLEALMIPSRLRLFGYTQSEALSVFGILTGMALPMILFPNVVTNSVSVMLLPAISEARAKHDHLRIQKAIKKTIESCMILGLMSTLFFLLSGRFIGEYVFGNTLAGTFICTLSWICPFLFLSTTLTSILHGLGRPTTTFLLNLLSSGIRILGIYAFIPMFGIRAYLMAMLLSQLFLAGSATFLLVRFCKKSRHAMVLSP